MNPDLSARRPLKSRSAAWAGCLARGLLRAGIRPNQVSAASAVFALGTAGCLLYGGRVLTGETKGFLASTAKIQWALLVCVYAVSHMPMILSLPLKGYEGQNAKLWCFFVLTAPLCDVLQDGWGKTCGRRKVAPQVSPSKTWEGTLGGIGSTVLISTCLYWATPFRPWQAALMALLICVAGFFGGLVMSAIKRGLGAKDWGSSIEGHGGFMNRNDSRCFAAPLFFHRCGFYFSTGMDSRPPETGCGNGWGGRSNS